MTFATGSTLTKQHNKLNMKIYIVDIEQFGGCMECGGSTYEIVAANNPEEAGEVANKHIRGGIESVRELILPDVSKIRKPMFLIV